MRRGSSFMEYMVILGIISAVLWGMNIYVKRGVQGKVKDLTDSLIGKGQETDISPTAKTTSGPINIGEPTSVYDSTANTQVFLGGGWRVDSLENVGYNVHSEITDTDIPYTGGNLVPAPEGDVKPGPPVKDPPGGSGD